MISRACGNPDTMKRTRGCSAHAKSDSLQIEKLVHCHVERDILDSRRDNWHQNNGSTWLRPNKKISVFRVTVLKILGTIGHIFLLTIFFLKKNIILCILKGISPFKMHKIILIQKT